MSKFCDVQKFKSVYEHRVGTQFDNAIFEMEKERFCIDAIPIPKEATNGSMVKVMFPKAQVIEVKYFDGIVSHYQVDFGEIGGNRIIVNFKADWWNAPYVVLEQEPKIGHWVRYAGGSFIDDYRCDCCNNKPPKKQVSEKGTWGWNFTSFCPNCGAKMESEE